MKKFILLILFIPFIQAKSQTSVYHPFPDSNAVWNVNTWYCCYGGCPGPPTPNPLITNSNYTYFISGDTIINGSLYNKVYKNGYSHEYCVTGGNINNWFYWDSVYYGGLREDVINKKLYLNLSAGVNECLLYDFDLNIGDTLKDNCQLQIYGIVTGIDSIMIGSTFRKKINLSVGTPPFALIEGIGTTGGLFESLYDFEAGATLLCFKQDNQILFPDTATVCEVITVSVPEKEILFNLKIFPNPTTDELNISFNLEKATDIEMQLFNSFGQRIKLIPINKLSADENKIKISLEDVPGGIYFLKIGIGEKEMLKKIIKY